MLKILMMKAPSSVDQTQLKDLGLKIDLKKIKLLFLDYSNIREIN